MTMAEHRPTTSRSSRARAGVAGLTCLLGAVAIGLPTGAAAATVLVVHPGQSIQAAVDRARPGDDIVVRPGVYREVVTIQTDRLTLTGNGATLLPPARTPAPDCLGGRSGATYGLCVLGAFDRDFQLVRAVRGVSLSGFTVRGFAGSNIVVFGASGTSVTRTTLLNGGGYGVLSAVSTDSRLVANRTQGNDEAGIYVGSSPQARATVQDNTSTADGQIGIFIRDASRGVVQRNVVSGSCIGIGLLDIPEPGIGPIHDWTVEGNVVTGSRGFCRDTPPLSGTGILFAGLRHSVIRNNVVSDNAAPPDRVSPLAGGIVAAPAGTYGSRSSSDVLVARNVVVRNSPADLVRPPTAGADLVFTGNVCGASRPQGLCRSGPAPAT